MNPRIVAEWRRSWRWLSIQIGAAATLFGLLPADQQAALLTQIGLRQDQLPLALGVAFMAARLLQQGPKQ